MLVARVKKTVRLHRQYPLTWRGAWTFAGNQRALDMFEIAIRNAEPGGSELVGQTAMFMAAILISKEYKRRERRQNALRADDDGRASRAKVRDQAR